MIVKDHLHDCDRALRSSHSYAGLPILACALPLTWSLQHALHMVEQVSCMIARLPQKSAVVAMARSQNPNYSGWLAMLMHAHLNEPKLSKWLTCRNDLMT